MSGNERATLRKLWRQTGNSSLLPAKCWLLLHVIAGISAGFSNFAFVLFCYITNHLMTGPLGNSEFCFPRISMFPSASSRETLGFSGNKIYCSPRDQSLSVYYVRIKIKKYIKKTMSHAIKSMSSVSLFWKWKCPVAVSSKPGRFKILFVNRIIAIVLIVKAHRLAYRWNRCCFCRLTRLA